MACATFEQHALEAGAATFVHALHVVAPQPVGELGQTLRRHVTEGAVDSLRRIIDALGLRKGGHRGVGDARDRTSPLQSEAKGAER
eukprot:9499031-Pyramimonas_sp.AAC.1